MLHLGYIALLATLWPGVVAQDASLGNVVAAFEEFHVPEDLNINFAPLVLLEVTFPQNGSDPITVSAGDLLEMNQTAIMPMFAINGTAPSNGSFVIAVVDPDDPIPSDPQLAQFLQFLGGNFTSAANGSLTNTTAAAAEFVPPAPPAASDPHRFVFLLFNQSPKFATQTTVGPMTPREDFNISTFASEMLLGDPIAGTLVLVTPAPASSSG